MLKLTFLQSTKLLDEGRPVSADRAFLVEIADVEIPYETQRSQDRILLLQDGIAGLFFSFGSARASHRFSPEAYLHAPMAKSEGRL